MAFNFLLAAGIGLAAGGGILKARSAKRGADFDAAQAEVAARHAKIRADETDTALREELSAVIGNIRAIRASSGISTDSPTTQAVIDNESKIANRERRIRVFNELAQAESDTRSAGQLRRSGREAFLYGSLGSIGSGFLSLARAGQ
jgi:hypothetical protein